MPPLFRDRRLNPEGMVTWSGLTIRSSFFVLLGFVVGLEIGSTTGALRSAKILDQEGTLQRVKESVKKIKEEIVQRELDMRNNVPTRGPSTAAGQVQTPADVDEGDNSALASQFEDNQDRSSTFRDELATSQNIGAESPRREGDIIFFPIAYFLFSPVATLTWIRYSAGSATEAAPPTRWDELRNNRTAQPSTWERIRQEKSRENFPPTSSSQNGDVSSRPDELVRSTNRDREAERREFERLMDLERKGGNDPGDRL
jgi:hypothetical protein